MSRDSWVSRAVLAGMTAWFFAGATPSSALADPARGSEDLPWIRISSPAPHEWKQFGRVGLHLTREESVLLRGRVRPGATLQVDEQDVAVDDEGRFEWELQLEEGARTVALTIRDEHGLNRHALAFLRDRTPPELVLETPKTGVPTPPGRLILGGRALDPRPKEVRVDGEPAKLVGDRWWKSVELGPEGGEWTVSATDQLGNTSSRSFRIEATTRPTTGRLTIDGLRFLRMNPDTGLEEYRHEQTGIELVLIPGGVFRMGYEKDLPPLLLWPLSPNLHIYDQQWYDMQQQPAHDVELSPYLVARTELTRAQWARLAEHDTDLLEPDFPADEPTTLPATDLSHDRFRRWLDRTRPRLSFPTEAQWEHACRAGTDTDFWTGEDLPGRWKLVQDRREGPEEVGSLPANPWGLHDVHGNAAEWCEDWFAPYETDRARDPRVLVEPNSVPARRILRGGYLDEARRRFANPSWFRDALPPDVRRPTLGLRPVLNLDELGGPRDQSP